MKPLVYEGRALSCDGVALADVAAKVGTPSYVYSASTILENLRAYQQALSGMPHTVYYAMKANGNLSILRLMANAGAGFDIVSGGELFRVLRAGGDPAKVVFSGVGKTRDEIDAALEAGIFAFNCESEPEIALLDALAHRRSIKARIAIRVNPDVQASTHAYISTGGKAHKFGIDIDHAEAVFARAHRMTNLHVEGVSCHIGSQIFDAGSMLRAIDRVLALIANLRVQGIDIRHIDVGGGLGVSYNADQPDPAISAFVAAVRDRVAGHDLHLMLEPGRSIVANAGVLLTRVLYRKRTGNKEFVITDAAMNDLIRPALYDAHHEILAVRKSDDAPMMVADVVGPICESGDFLAHDRPLPEVMPGDLLAVCTAGAYGFAQSSTYNARPRAAEVLIENGAARIIRRRETYADLIRGEEI
jgi:diaminopimelate decarboxylase